MFLKLLLNFSVVLQYTCKDDSLVPSPDNFFRNSVRWYFHVSLQSYYMGHDINNVEKWCVKHYISIYYPSWIMLQGQSSLVNVNRTRFKALTLLNQIVSFLITQAMQMQAHKTWRAWLSTIKQPLPDLAIVACDHVLEEYLAAPVLKYLDSM